MGQNPSTPSPSSISSAPPLQHDQSSISTSPSSSPPSACPVDPKSRDVWLRAASQTPQLQPHPASTPTITTPQAPHPLSPGSDVSACPVDHKSREAWLKAAQAQQAGDTGQGDGSARPPAAFRPKLTNSRLSTHREVSSIPRAFPNETIDANTAMSAASPSLSTSSSPAQQPNAHGKPNTTAVSPNAQTLQSSDIHTSATGHWVYPSEKMFFAAMARKQHNPRAADMPSIIPIHNAVNERTWSEVLEWERGQGGERCGGPKLVSFQGDSGKLTPRARWRGWMGWKRPFDRHDWVVERCGTQVEYVIDFYEGRGAAGPGKAGAVSFFLDVRPKLNSWEGWRMRFMRYWGLG